MNKIHTAWAIKYTSINKIEGKREFLLGPFYGSPTREFKGSPAILFKTRKDARDFIKEKFGYIKDRPDLRDEPHGWKMPVPVKVDIQVLVVD